MVEGSVERVGGLPMGQIALELLGDATEEGVVAQVAEGGAELGAEGEHGGNERLDLAVEGVQEGEVASTDTRPDLVGDGDGGCGRGHGEAWGGEKEGEKGEKGGEPSEKTSALAVGRGVTSKPPEISSGARKLPSPSGGSSSEVGSQQQAKSLILATICRSLSGPWERRMLPEDVSEGEDGGWGWGG